jgi:hypothetical protein
MSLHTVVIGGGGHVGSSLAPRLVHEGHRVTAITRGLSEPYGESPLWRDVERLQLDRDAAERDASFGRHSQRLAPDIVVDLICYRLESAPIPGRGYETACRQSCMRHDLRQRSRVQVPTTEDQRRATRSANTGSEGGDRGISPERRRETAGSLSRCSIGHVVGEGWWPVNPQGERQPPPYSRAWQPERN